jgi:uncharacterized protein YhbP (UPF0306 family)
MILRSIRATDVAAARVDVKRLTAARVRKTLLRVLLKNPLCALSTVAPGNRAHVSPVYFAYSQSLDVYFLSHPDSLHCRNLKGNSTMAIGVFQSPQEWGALDRGVQLFGSCREARGVEARKAERAYAARFKPYAQWKKEPGPDEAPGEYRFYRFVTRRLKLFDEREFGGGVFVTATVSGRASAARRR